MIVSMIQVTPLRYNPGRSLGFQTLDRNSK
jgi:hypothetical protein